MYVYEKIEKRHRVTIITIHRELWEGPTHVSALIHAATMVYTMENDNSKDVSNKSKSLDPYFITGYADGESSYSIRFRKSIDSK